MKKVIFLSHSTEKNLTEGWENTTSLVAPHGCVSCHKLIYQWKDCKQVEDTGIAECQANITPQMVWDAIRAYLDQKEAA
jgi:hypothetical protein